MGTDEALAAAVEATIAKMQATKDAREQESLRKLAILDMRRAGMSMPGIARALQDAMVERGYTLEQLKGVGISHDSVRKLLEKA